MLPELNLYAVKLDAQSSITMHRELLVAQIILYSTA